MPRINRIRVTNIHYDNGKKQIPDITVHAKGLDTILLLGNGFGKTLLIQLIMQVILPNERMNGRRVSDLLSSQQYTGHVAVEWLLDGAGEQKQFLCTGFCFSNGQSRDQKIRYYNYLFDYDARSDLSIDSLPLVQSGEKGESKRPIRYQELRDWLREQGVQVFDQINTYHERLRIYQILPEEWKNIRDTNGSEGGVDKFFEKSRTTQQLLDNLLIPSVEEMIFQTERKKKELFYAFGEYRNMLLEIPVIKQNLRDFALIRDHAETVVSEVQELDRLQKELEESIKGLVRLAKTFSLFQIETARRIENLKTEKEEIKTAIEELLWKKESYDVFLKRLDYQKALADLEKVEKEYLRQKKTADEAQRRVQELNAFYYYQQAESAQQDMKKYQNELELVDKAEPELQERLNRKRQELKNAWERKRVHLEKRAQLREEELRRLVQEFENLSSRVKHAREKVGNLREQLGRYSIWFEQYKQLQNSIQTSVSEEAVLNPVLSLEQHQNILKGCHKKEHELTVYVKELKHRQERIEKELLEWKFEQKTHGDRLEALQKRIDEAAAEANAILGLLSGQARFCRSLFAEKEEILLWLRDSLKEAQEKRVTAQAELANLQEKWALLEGKNYYLPHHELLRIKRRLERANVSAVIGSEWLAEQKLSEAEKETYLKHQPLLPFAVIIEPTQLNVVKRLMSREEWSWDVPLLFLVKSTESLRPGEGTDRFVPLWQDSLFVYQPGSMRMYTSHEAFRSYVNQMEENMEKKQRNLQELRDQENSLLSLKERIEGFYRRYPEQEVAAWKQAQKELQEQIITLESAINEGGKEAKRLESEVSQAQQELEETRQAGYEENQIIQQLQNYLEWFRIYPIKQDEENEARANLNQLLEQIEEWERQKEKNKDTQGELKQNIKDIQKNISVHLQDFRDYQLEEVVPTAVAGKSYEDVKTEIQAILDRLKEKHAERSRIEELVGQARKRYQDALYQVKKTGLEFEWVDENYRQVTLAEIEEAESFARDQQQRSKMQEDLVNQGKSSTQSAKTLWEDAAKRVRDRFGKEAYTGFSKTGHELEIKNTKQKIEQLNQTLDDLERQIKDLEDWEKENMEAYETVSEKMEDLISARWDEVEPFSHQEWDSVRRKPGKVVQEHLERKGQLTNKIDKQQQRVNHIFKEYLNKLESTQNVKVRQFTRAVQAIVDDNHLYDYDFVQTQFLRIFEGLDQYEAQYKLTLQECEKNKDHLINLCQRRARTVYDSVIEIPKNSRVKIYGRDIQVIRIEWKALDEEEGHHKMAEYLERVVDNLQSWKQEGLDDDEIDRRMEDLLRTRNLIQVIAPLEDCRVTVYKPRQEAVVRQQRLDYALWDEVTRWSGGEEYSIYITMFMVLISHIRMQTEGQQNGWKVVVADNPFGKASSPHILETIFQVAKSNKIQLICLTAHKEETILQRFPVVYSLQLRLAYGKEIMKAEQMESGFYRFETAADSGAQLTLRL